MRNQWYVDINPERNYENSKYEKLTFFIVA